MSWIARITDTTRGQLLALLRRSRRSINELAAGVGITDNAVRMHVAALQRDGLVEAAGVERGTGGKPAQLYQLTTDAEELFPKAYAVVLSELIGLLEEREGRDAVTALLREVGARAAPAGGGVEPGLEAGVRRAAAVLTALGGDVEVARDPAGGWTIRGFGCPLSAVVREHAEACCLAETLVSEIAGAPAVEACSRGDRPRCAFRIPDPEGLPPGSAAA